MTGDNSGQTYVINGASIVCSAGTSRGSLLLPGGHNFAINEQANLNIGDSQSMVNICPMGSCKNKKMAPCIPAPSGQWQQGKSNVEIAGLPALLNTSIIPCSIGGVISIVADGQ